MGKYLGAVSHSCMAINITSSIHKGLFFVFNKAFGFSFLCQSLTKKETIVVKQNFRINKLTVGTVPNKKRNNSGETKF